MMAFRTINAIPMPGAFAINISNSRMFTEIGAKMVMANALLLGIKMRIPPMISNTLMTAI